MDVVREGLQPLIRRLTPYRLLQVAYQGGPGTLALLWLGSLMLRAYGASHYKEELSIGLALFMASLPVLVAMAVARILDVRDWSVQLAGAFVILDIIAAACRMLLATAWQTIGMGEGLYWLLFWAIATWTSFMAVAILHPVSGAAVRRLRALAFLPVALMLLTNWYVERVESALHALYPSYETGEAEEVAAGQPDIAIDTLIESQPPLLQKALAGMRGGGPGPAYYIVTVAAGGAQELFAREAKVALDVFTQRHGGAVRGAVLLSNGAKDLETVPLATQGNLDKVIGGIGQRMDKAGDTAILYLVSHGSQHATLQTDLYNGTSLRQLSAPALAKALKDAGVGRRIVIISACYSGTWIGPLKSPDTIVISAAAPDRTSFGCSDENELTDFGEAFLRGPLTRGESLKSAFETTRVIVNREEQKAGLTPSKPQAFIGANMQSEWKGEPVAAGDMRD